MNGNWPIIWIFLVIDDLILFKLASGESLYCGLVTTVLDCLVIRFMLKNLGPVREKGDTFASRLGSLELMSVNSNIIDVINGVGDGDGDGAVSGDYSGGGICGRVW